MNMLTRCPIPVSFFIASVLKGAVCQKLSSRRRNWVNQTVPLSKMTMNKIKAIEKYGHLYVERFLQKQIASKADIYNDPQRAIEFFFMKVFYRGRRDELSERFINAALKTIRERRPSKNYDKTLFNNQLISNGVNNGHDRRMVLEVLDFTFNSLGPYSNNIVQYTIHQIKERKIADVFNELIGIHAIGNKLASFYLRDVIIIYQLEKLLKPDEFRYCQPIDTWVKQVALKIGIITQKNEDIEDTKNAIIETCLDAGLSPLLFNAGMWMVGDQSFELLIEGL